MYDVQRTLHGILHYTIQCAKYIVRLAMYNIKRIRLTIYIVLLIVCDIPHHIANSEYVNYYIASSAYIILFNPN